MNNSDFDFIIDLSAYGMPVPNPVADDLVNGIRVPTVFCERTPSDLYKFFCPWCDTWHYHGAEEGHRIAHCHIEDSPYLDTGYVLMEVDTAPMPPQRFKPQRLKDGRRVSGRPIPGRNPR